MYEGKRLGPALGRLRRRKDLKTAEVAERLGLSGSSVSRIESESSNPHSLNLTRYLDAIGCSLSDLDGELSLQPDPLEREIARDDQRLEDSPVYRDLYRRMFREMGYDAASLPAGRVLEMLLRFEARLESLEDKERERSEGSGR